MISFAFHRFAALMLALTLGTGFLGGTEPGAVLYPAEASSTIPFIPEVLKEEARRFSVPLLFGLAPARVTNSWGEERDGGRAHNGIDIIAPRGTFVLSPTDALITNVGYDDLGGNYVLSANPGGEQFYYAHLEDVAPGILPGKILKRGDLIGYVGNTGNARQSLPHLHLGIYSKGAATNPYPRLSRVFSLEEHITILEQIASEPDVSFSVVFRLTNVYQDFFQRAQEAGFTFPRIVAWVFRNNDVLAKARLFESAIAPGSENDGVHLLQEFLVRENVGLAARALAEAGATGYFGARTRNALTEYQVAKGIVPAEGYFDPLTKTRVLDALSLDALPVEADVSEANSDGDLMSFFRRFFGEARDYFLFTQVLPDREGTGENGERESEGELIQDEISPV